MSNYDKAFDYTHQFKAGNVGDVLKHVTLCAWAQAIRGDGPLRVLDSHAGAGVYKLGPTGEWTAGIGRLEAADSSEAPSAISDYLSALGGTRTPNRGGPYRGSPALLSPLVDQLLLVEQVDEVREKLAAKFTAEHITIRGGDGYVAVGEAEVDGVFMDPPYTRREEWDQVVQALITAHGRGLHGLLWYPIKSLARPNTLHAKLREAELPFFALDLVTAAFGKRRKALNGSGVVILRPPAGLPARLSAAATWLGPVLAQSEWQLRAAG